MTRSEERNCTWVQARLEPYLDHELPPAEAGELQAHLLGCAACARERELASRIRAELRALPPQSLSQRAADAVYARVRADRLAAFRFGLRHWLAERLAPSWRPLAAAAALTMLIGTGVVYRSHEQAARAAQVARAERQVRWTLAYLGQVGHRTGLTVRDEVIRARVVDPLQRGLRAAVETGAM